MVRGGTNYSCSFAKQIYRKRRSCLFSRLHLVGLVCPRVHRATLTKDTGINHYAVYFDFTRLFVFSDIERTKGKDPGRIVLQIKSHITQFISLSQRILTTLHSIIITTLSRFIIISGHFFKRTHCCDGQGGNHQIRTYISPGGQHIDKVYHYHHVRAHLAYW